MHRPVNEVAIPPMSTHMYTFSATEPQYVSTRVPNQGWLYISSQDSPEGTDRTNYTVGTSEILSTGMNRIKAMGFATYWNVPNVNPRNNVISFYSSNTGGIGGTIHTTAPLNVRYYDIRLPADEAALIADILAKLNALAGPSGLTWAAAPVVGFPQTYTLSTVGGTYAMYLPSLALRNGQQMYDFPREQVLSASKLLGTMNFTYTEFVDIVSRRLESWDKMQSASTGHIGSLVMRAYVGGQFWGHHFQDISANPIEMSWKADEPLTTFDIRFFDMNGDPLYQPNDGKSWIWQLSLLAEM